MLAFWTVMQSKMLSCHNLFSKKPAHEGVSAILYLPLFQIYVLIPKQSLVRLILNL